MEQPITDNTMNCTVANAWDEIAWDLPCKDIMLFHMYRAFLRHQEYYDQHQTDLLLYRTK